jgi:hypothetical protein
MTSKLACALVFTAVLALGAASAQTGGRVTAIPGGPAVARVRTPSDAELVARVAVLEAQVIQLTARVDGLGIQMMGLDGYSTHWHNFNDDISPDDAVHDITGPPHS